VRLHPAWIQRGFSAALGAQVGRDCAACRSRGERCCQRCCRSREQSLRCGLRSRARTRRRRRAQTCGCPSSPAGFACSLFWPGARESQPDCACAPQALRRKLIKRRVFVPWGCSKALPVLTPSPAPAPAPAPAEVRCLSPCRPASCSGLRSGLNVLLATCENLHAGHRQESKEICKWDFQLCSPAHTHKGRVRRGVARHVAITAAIVH